MRENSEQFLHHVGQPPGLRDDDVHSLPHILGVLQLAALDGLRPSGDGGQGVRSSWETEGDELRLGLSPTALIFRDIFIDGVGELPYLVIELFLDLHPIAPRRQ